MEPKEYTKGKEKSRVITKLNTSPIEYHIEIWQQSKKTWKHQGYRFSSTKAEVDAKQFIGIDA